MRGSADLVVPVERLVGPAAGATYGAVKGSNAAERGSDAIDRLAEYATRVLRRKVGREDIMINVKEP